MRFRLPYGRAEVEADLPWGHVLGTLEIADPPPVQDLAMLIESALAHPIGMEGALLDRMSAGERVCIIVSDSFRKTCIHRVLPYLVGGLTERGIRDEDISFVFGTGTHRPPAAKEQEAILGPAMYAWFADRAFPHEPWNEEQLVYMGTTQRGTPVYLNKRVAESDRVIVTGAVVMHYFGGFGGGRKGIVPGVAGGLTIAHNHAMNLDPEADRINPAVCIGVMAGNPVAEDMLEAAHMLGTALLVNTVLNRHGEIAAVFAGDLELAHAEAAQLARQLYSVRIRERADLVIAASGDAKDYVQTHKALYNAYQAVKEDGRIILVAKCEEGLGGEQFQKWIRLGSREAIIKGLREQSEINGQTALSTIEKTPITVMVTDLPEGDVALLGARKAITVDEALAIVRDELPAGPTCYLMPSAAYTVPFGEALGAGQSGVREG